MIKSFSMRLWHHFKEDSLFQNSVYLMTSTGVMAVFGFAFWIFVARLFPTKEVGIATTLISVIALLSNFSLLGFNTSLIRYLPKSNQRSEKINSVLLLVILASIVAAIIFMSGLHIFAPKLEFLRTKIFYIITFIAFIIGLSFNTLIDSIFIAYRSSVNVLIKSSILSIFKLLLPFFFVFLGSYGIFTSVGLATFVSALIGFIILFFRFNYQPSFSFNKNVVKEMAVFSGGNYIAGFLSQMPNLILPLLIIDRLNSETAAYFYMDMMILGFLSIISTATTQSLLAEGSYDESKLPGQFLKATRLIFIFLVPIILIISLFGNLLLHAFGKDYASSAFSFLQIISISSLFSSLSSLGTAVLRIRHQIRALIMMNLLGVVLILGLSYLFIGEGLVGIGWGWLVGQAMLSLAYLLFLSKEIFAHKKAIFRLAFRG